MSDTPPEPQQYMQPVPGRSCGSCSLCCKVQEIKWLNKPANKWCQHSDPGRGCKIWDARPQGCIDYFCWYMTEAQLGPEWRPDKSKFIINFRAEENRFIVNVDNASPAAWRQEPYYSSLKRISGELLDRNIIVQIITGGQLTYLTPDQETTIDRPADPATRIDLQLMITLLPNGTKKRWFKAELRG